MVTYTFGQSAAQAVIESMGWHINGEGYLWDDDEGDAVLSVSEQPVHITEFAGVVEWHGEARPVRDDFNELVDYVEYRREQEAGDA